MRIYEFASMGGTSSGGIATVATSMNSKPIKRVDEVEDDVEDEEDDVEPGKHNPPGSGRNKFHPVK